MLILALDLAVCTGYALGPADGQPRSGVVRVKRPEDALYAAPWNLETFLQDINAFGLPDLVIYEAPIPLNAQMGDGRARNEESLLMPIKLEQGVERYCLPRQIRWEKVFAATVRKHFLGKANFGDRQTTKNEVVKRCRLAGYIRPDEVVTNKSSDPLFDRCDALAVWDWTAYARGRRRPGELVLHGQQAPA